MFSNRIQSSLVGIAGAKSLPDPAQIILKNTNLNASAILCFTSACELIDPRAF
jgi:hypothetical protein